MAGDWIKMRAELYTHPRFIALCSALIFNEQWPGMLVYTCGDALEIGVMPPSHRTVTERALRCVTERALCDVTMGALLRVWCSVNAHCKVRESDAVMSPMNLPDLDRIAGFSDFGAALESVGWVRVDDANTLIFPHFLEFNEPACLRHTPLTNAERQRNLRARRKGLSTTSTPPVTRVTKSNGREEKRREDTIPSVPNGTEGATAAPARAARPIRKETWLDRLNTVWKQQYGGDFNFGEAGKVCRPLVQEHGIDEVVRRLTNYCRSVAGQFASVSKFASTWSVWIAMKQPPPRQPARFAAGRTMESIDEAFGGDRAPDDDPIEVVR